MAYCEGFCNEELGYSFYMCFVCTAAFAHNMCARKHYDETGHKPFKTCNGKFEEIIARMI